MLNILSLTRSNYPLATHAAPTLRPPETTMVSKRPASTLPRLEPTTSKDELKTVPPTSGWFSSLWKILQRIEDFQLRNGHLNNLKSATPYAFPRSGHALYDFFWTKHKSVERRGYKLFVTMPGSIFRFIEILKVALERGYTGNRMRAACRALIFSTLGHQDDARSAQSALRRLYREQHTDKRGNGVWVPPEDEKGYSQVYECLNVIKTILATEGLRESLFAEEVPRSTNLERLKSFFSNLKLPLTSVFRSLLCQVITYFR